MFLSSITSGVRRIGRLATVAATIVAGSPSAHASQAAQEIIRATPKADVVIIAPVSRFAKNMKAARDSGQYSTALLKLVEESRNRDAASEILANGVIVHRACAASGTVVCKDLTAEACKAEAAAAKTKAVKSETPGKCVAQTVCEIKTEFKCNEVWNAYKESALDEILKEN